MGAYMYCGAHQLCCTYAAVLTHSSIRVLHCCTHMGCCMLYTYCAVHTCRGNGSRRCFGNLHSPQHEHHRPASDGGGIPLPGRASSGGHLHLQLHGTWSGRPCRFDCHIPGNPHWHHHYDRQAMHLCFAKSSGLNCHEVFAKIPKRVQRWPPPSPSCMAHRAADHVALTATFLGTLIGTISMTGKPCRCVF